MSYCINDKELIDLYTLIKEIHVDKDPNVMLKDYINAVNGNYDKLYDFVAHQADLKRAKKPLELNKKMYSEDVFDSPKHDENIEEEMIEKPPTTKSKLYTCNKCESKGNIVLGCMSDSRQIRSGDEGATTFINCLDCGVEWTE